MKINNIPISNYGATLVGRIISPNRVSTSTSWDFRMDSPIYYGSSLDFKKVSLSFVFTCNTEEIFVKNLGIISEALRHGAVVRFDDISLDYTMYITEIPDYEKLNATNYRVDFELNSDFGVTDYITTTGSTKVSVTNSGTYPTPVRLTLTVPASQSKLTIYGLDRTFVLKDTPNNANIIIDSELGLITVNGVNAIDKVDSFYLPKLPIGANQVSCSTTCDITVSYRERY